MFAVAVWLCLLVLPGGALGAVQAATAAPPTLSGETFHATVSDSSFIPTCFSSGAHTVYFAFSGTAAGPYTGLFTETGQITYTLNLMAPGFGPITAFSAAYVITSPAGTVTGSKIFALAGVPTASCTTDTYFAETDFGTAAIPTAYTATIATPSGGYRDQGASSATLGSWQSQYFPTTGGSVLDESFASAMGGAQLLVPASTGPPTIAGDLTEGQTLAESHGSWTNAPTSFSYQWQRCDSAGGSCNAIADAAGQAHKLTSSDVGHTIRVQEWATSDAGTGWPATSVATGVIAPASGPPIKPRVSLPPVVSGLILVGRRLSATTGAWYGTPPLTFSYRWQRCTTSCANIPGATGRSYALTIADGGGKVRVLVTASNSVGSARAASTQVGPILASPAWVKTQLLKQLAPSGNGAKIGALLKKSGYTFSFNVFGAGRVEIDWYYLPKGATLSKAKRPPVLIATGHASFAKTRLVKLTLKLTTNGKRMLKATNRLQLTAKGAYTLKGNPAVAATKTFTLRR